MLRIANDEIMLLLDEKVFFFNENGYYTSISTKEAKKKNFKHLSFDRNSRTFTYSKPYILLFDDNLKLISIKEDVISRAILRLVEGETPKDFEKYIFHYQNLISQKSYPIQDLKNMVIRRKSKKYIFFNNEEVIETLNQTEILKSDVINLCVTIYGTLYFSDIEINKFNSTEFVNRVFLTMVYCQLKNGDTIEDLKQYYHNSSFQKREPLTELDYFVTKIGQPQYIRVPENANANTFDYIYVEVNLAITWKYDKKEYYVKNKEAIDKMVTDKIEKSKKFQKYNIPINFLNLTRVSLKNQRRILEYVFDLKRC